MSGLTGILLARDLGPHGRGALAIVVTWPTFGGLLGLLGLAASVSYWSSRSEDAAPSLLSTALILAAVLGSVVTALGWIGAPYIASDDQVVDGLRTVFTFSPLVTAQIVATASLQPKNIHIYSALKPLQPFTYLVFVLYLDLSDQLTVASAVKALVLSLIIQFLVSSLLAIKLVRLSWPRYFLMTRLLSYGVKVWATSTPLLVNQRVDQLVLSLTVPKAMLGNYAVAVSISALALPFGYAIGSVVFPRAASETLGQRLARSSLLVAAGAAMLIVLPIALVAPWLMPRLLGSGFSETTTMLWLLAPGTVALTSSLVGKNILNGQGRPLSAAAAEGVGAAATLLLLFLLVPALGALGAAVASSLAYCAVLATQIWFLRRRGRFEVPVKQVRSNGLV